MLLLELEQLGQCHHGHCRMPREQASVLGFWDCMMITLVRLLTIHLEHRLIFLQIRQILTHLILYCSHQHSEPLLSPLCRSPAAKFLPYKVLAMLCSSIMVPVGGLSMYTLQM